MTDPAQTRFDRGELDQTVSDTLSGFTAASNLSKREIEVAFMHARALKLTLAVLDAEMALEKCCDEFPDEPTEEQYAKQNTEVGRLSLAVDAAVKACVEAGLGK